MFEKIELLAPAGDLNKLKTAIDYGADAVYLAGTNYGLRTASKNLTNDDLREAVKYCHDRGKKIYVTMNIIAHNRHFKGAEDYIRFLDDIGVDAIIASDVGMISLLKKVVKNAEIHLSTQASVTNFETCKFWKEQGVDRIILARELSLEEIKEIKSQVDIDLETFVHGAMCISYSGRCLLSNYMCGRDANLGDCAHACRWKYHLVEEKRPGEYYEIEDTEDGAFILNSKDLCMIDNIDKLIECGIDSLKIEGRVKSEYYVATVVRSYRMAIDAYYEGRYDENISLKLLSEIRKASHRDFTHGFFLEKPDSNAQIYDRSSYIRLYDFLAKVLSYDEETSIATLEQRNKISLGDKVEVFGPNIDFFEMTIDNLSDENGDNINEAPHAQQIIKIKMPKEVKTGYMLRKR